MTKSIIVSLFLLSTTCFGACEDWEFATQLERREIKLCKIADAKWEGAYASGGASKFTLELTARRATLAELILTHEPNRYKATFVGVQVNADGILSIYGTGRDVDNNTFEFTMKKL